MLDCSALEFESMNTMPEVPAGSGGTEQDGSGGRHPVWLCLDEVMDPVRMLGGSQGQLQGN